MIKEEFGIEIEPLTPVFVWSGETLYSNADFRLVNGKIIVIDPYKALGKVKDLKEAFKEDFAREIQGVKLVFQSNTLPNTILMINEYLIPASTVKGLIRTAILNKLADKAVYEKVNENLNQLNALNFKQAVRNVKNVAHPVEMLLKRQLERYTYDSLSKLLVSDPKAIGISLSLKKVLVLETVGQFKSETYVIALEKGKLVYDGKILQPKNYGVYSDLRQLDSKITKSFILDSLKEYSKLILEREKKKVGKLTKYSEFLNSLKVEGNCIPLKIGMFTGHIAKTISLPPNVEKVRESIMTKLTGHLWDNRTVKLIDDLGVGWVRLCIR